MHAGLLPEIVARRSLDDLNEDTQKALAGEMQGTEARELLGPRGPVWARDYAFRGDASCERVGNVLSKMGANRMVVGHTIQRDFRVHARCGGRVILGDTAISQSYGGAMTYLEHDEHGVTAVYPGTGERQSLLSSDVDPRPDPNFVTATAVVSVASAASWPQPAFHA